MSWFVLIRIITTYLRQYNCSLLIFSTFLEKKVFTYINGNAVIDKVQRISTIAVSKTQLVYF